MSRMNPLVYYTLTISLTVLSASAATSQCEDKIAACSDLPRVCDDPVASVHICPWTCEKCEEYNNLPRASCQNKMDTFFCEMAANCVDKFHVYLCPLTCGKCELVTSQTSTVTASSTIVSTTSPSTSTFTQTSTLMPNQSRPTSPTTASTTSQALPIVTESTTGANIHTNMSSVSGRVTASSTIVSTTSPSTSTFTRTSTLMSNQSRPTSPTTASATSQTWPIVTESTTAATIHTNMSSVPGRASIASTSTSTSTRTSAHTSTYQTSTRPETTTTGPQTSTVITGSTIVSTMDTQKSSTPELRTSETSTMTVSSTIESSRLSTLIEIFPHTSAYNTSTWSHTTITGRPTWTMITRLASASTMDTQKSSAPATTNTRRLKPSVCSQCGNLDGDLPCTDEEIFEADSSQCHDDTPYCMNDIIQTNGHMSMYKRCVNETICNSEWYMESSDKQQCTQFDPSIYKDDLVCHLCCYGDDCNANNVPPAEKLYKP